MIKTTLLYHVSGVRLCKGVGWVQAVRSHREVQVQWSLLRTDKGLSEAEKLTQ